MFKGVDSFQNLICWDTQSRPKVMETVALRASDSIFHATHFPCPINKLNPNSGAKSRYSEQELFIEFLDERIDHFFSVAIGDTGTGKSHLVRWLHSRLGLDKEASGRFNTVIIKRHSANLAAVLESILSGFNSPEVQKIKDDIQWTHNITEQGACNRVISELAFVLDPDNLSSSQLSFTDDEFHETIVPLLPAFLNDQAIRDYFIGNEHGVINNLADHLSSQKREFHDQKDALKWTANDLNFNSKIAKSTGSDAQELATAILADDDLKTICVSVLNKALEIALPNLAGLKQGNLGNALIEIRRELKKQKKELILLIEDLSVTQGIDSELIESLLVSPGDGGSDLCCLRSIIGLTNDDYAGLQDNLKDRIDVAVHFDVELATTNDKDQAKFSVNDLFDFASRYLNAARLGIHYLDQWLLESSAEEDCPSFCHQKDCPFIENCHKTFGNIDGRGLYPFSRIALDRLYRKQIESSTKKSFNPRMLVNSVLDYFLDSAEKKILENEFPASNYLDWFKLGEVGGSIQAQLLNKIGLKDSKRFRTALEIYSIKPFEGKLNPDIADAFNIPNDDLYEEELEAEEELDERQNIEVSVPKKDEFDLWLNENKISSQDVTKWRRVIYSAIKGAYPWDSSPECYSFYKYFSHNNIKVEGQHTRMRTDLILDIKKKPEIAMAIKGLVTNFNNSDPKEARLQKIHSVEALSKWSKQIEKDLRNHIKVSSPKEPIKIALQLLNLGALLFPTSLEQYGDKDALRRLFSPWYKNKIELNGSSSLKKIYNAFNQHGEKVRIWLHERLGCHKGNSIQVTFIDVAEIIESLPSAEHVRLVDYPKQAMDEWPKDYEALTDLAEEIRTYFVIAIEEETVKSQEWLDDLKLLLEGGYSQKNFEDILSAFKIGNDQDLFTDDTQVIEDSLYSLDADKLEAQVKLLKCINNDEILKNKLAAISKLDRAFIQETITVLNDASLKINSALERVETKLKSEGIENPKERFLELSENLEKLDSQLIDLKGKG